MSSNEDLRPIPNVACQVLAGMSPGPLPVRALTPYKAVPQGCILWPVQTDTAAPHLCHGEYAVVDTADRDPIGGELYLVGWRGGRRTIGQTNSRTVTLNAKAPDVPRWFLDPLARPKGVAEIDEWLRAGRLLPISEGPFKPGRLEQMIVGRIVGVIGGAA